MAKIKDKLALYQTEFEEWLHDLQPYHIDRFKTNYAQYSAQPSTRGTKAKISDPVSPELIERVIVKLFEKEPKFFSLARGKNLPQEVTDIISAVAEYYWTNPEVIQSSGTRRALLKLVGREFLITGNAGTETFFNGESDSPDFRILPVEDVIFDPAKTLKTSDVYYIRQFVSLDFLKDNAEIKEGGEVVQGRFKNIKKLERAIGKNETNDKTSDNTENRLDRTAESVLRRTDEIELISRWEGDHLIQWTPTLPDDVLRDVNDPLGIGDDPLNFVMDLEIPKEPYAMSFLDQLNGLTHAKDLILNQAVDYGAKALNPPLYVDPSISPVNRASLKNANKIGGIVFANPQQADHKAMPPFPKIGFDLLGYLQQRSESVSGIGSYLGGVPNQESDQTQGTKGGIEALIQQSASPVRDRQLNIEESIIEPVINQWLKMAGELMGKDETKYVFISGQKPKWVEVTRGLLTGRITIDDLLIAELIDEETAILMAAEMEERGEDPLKDPFYDVDWIVRVEAGSLAEVDADQQVRAIQSIVQQGIEMQLPIDKEKAWTDMARKAGVKEPDQYLLDPQEQQQQLLEEQGGLPQEGQVPGQPQQPQAQAPIQIPDNPFV